MSLPPTEEWDFERLLDPLSDAEISVCYHYEYARELKDVREAIANQRSFFEKFISDCAAALGIEPAIDFPGSIFIYIPLGAFEFFLNYPEWPEAPYLAIESQVRAQRLQLLLEDSTSDESLAKCLERPSFFEGAQSLNPNLWREVTLVIPSYVTHEQLQAAFAAYLRLKFPEQGKNAARPQRKSRIGKRRGRGSERRVQRDALRQLGVYRLMKQEVKPHRISGLLRNVRGELLYSDDESAVYRARNAARGRIEELKLPAEWSLASSRVALRL